MESGRVPAGWGKGVEEVAYFSEGYRIKELSYLLAHILLSNIC